MLHSFGLRFKPWTDYSEALRAELSRRASVEFQDHSLLNARRNSDKSEAPFVNIFAVSILTSARHRSAKQTQWNLSPDQRRSIQLQQVFSNLNGFDATSDATQAEKAVTVTTTRIGRFAEISVADTGPGVSEDAAKKIFDPFYSTKDHGMGMGLSIVRTIVEAHESEIKSSPTGTARTARFSESNCRWPKSDWDRGGASQGALARSMPYLVPLRIRLEFEPIKLVFSGADCRVSLWRNPAGSDCAQSSAIAASRERQLSILLSPEPTFRSRPISAGMRPRIGHSDVGAPM